MNIIILTDYYIVKFNDNCLIEIKKRHNLKGKQCLKGKMDNKQSKGGSKKDARFYDRVVI